MMSTAVVFTITGVSIALAGFDHRALYGHGIIGVVVFIAALVQPLPALFCRPDHGQPKRKYFNRVHWSFGSLALVLGAVNVLLGTFNYMTLWDNCTAPVFIGCAAAGIGGVVVLGVVLEALRHRAESSSPVQAGVEMEPPVGKEATDGKQDEDGDHEGYKVE
eukprot:TRINITY_DN16207_c0_g1_i1.p1 TRINITY_DN16207_c0_g1~~TRINITY_DN16207_c0_g1_i1.p1  ORF type:complete len:162 (+),score=51.16 TRINITY_DN16207_c0_g1_i1:1-486(+)